MNKLIISLTLSLIIISCNGPKSGPLVKESFEEKEQENAMAGHQHQSQAVAMKADIKIEPCAECITIGRLVGDKKSFSGEKIRVKGVVTKVNEAIMDKNWVHIQDGTEAGGIFDLTVTTSLKVAVGDTVTFEGNIVLDKDFGYGYFYNILMENGNLLK
jgi:hypothetical protein